MSVKIIFNSERNTFTAEGVLVHSELTHYASYRETDLSVSLALHCYKWVVLDHRGTLTFAKRQDVKKMVEEAWVNHHITGE